MLRFITTLEKFRNLVDECDGIAAGIITYPDKQSAYQQQLGGIISTCDEIIQEALIKGIFPEPISELDILRKQYLDLSKELYVKKEEEAMKIETEAIIKVLNNMVLKIKQIENIDPSQLVKD